MNPESLEMRSMQLVDISAVLAIEEATSEEPWSRNAFESCLTSPFFAWVLVDKKQIVGFAILQIVANMPIY